MKVASISPTSYLQAPKASSKSFRASGVSSLSDEDDGIRTLISARAGGGGPLRRGGRGGLRWGGGGEAERESCIFVDGAKESSVDDGELDE